MHLSWISILVVLNCLMIAGPVAGRWPCLPKFKRVICIFGTLNIKQIVGKKTWTVSYVKKTSFHVKYIMLLISLNSYI